MLGGIEGRERMADETPPRKAGVDWIDVRQKTVTAIVVAATLGIGTLLWNNLSQGGLLRLLGGVSQVELEAAVSQSGHIPHGAVVAFDIQCPPGWVIADEAIGSAIVGAGAVVAGELGQPLPNEGRFDAAGLVADIKRPSPFKRPDFVSHDPRGVPISRYVFGTKTAFTPSYLPLNYCKKI